MPLCVWEQPFPCSSHGDRGRISMSFSIIYDSFSGQVLEWCSPPLSKIDRAALPSGRGFINVDELDEDSLLESFVADGALSPRPLMPVTQSNAVAVGELWRIDGIPSGTV